ncbi:hypothetical protein SAMN04487939_10829 [Lysobacter sp. yr284]|uniref:hypothetical protein n=1 Tax=Lysobacter TaxID=68 RepID=UPI00089D55A7|nr:hypothetical protein [Lysobacter sp. yr284]SDY89623.1 hypothetical protein SAMN04487939_10829 [Lysobacter sp. yr284]
MKPYVLACLAAGSALLAIAAPATAGRAINYPVTIAPDVAYGSMLSARRSADTVQYIGCSLNSPDATHTVRYAQCDAVNAQGRRLICDTTDAGMIATVQSIGAYHYILFRVDAQGRCTAVNTWISSDTLP